MHSAFTTGDERSLLPTERPWSCPFHRHTRRLIIARGTTNSRRAPQGTRGERGHEHSSVVSYW